MLSLCNGHFTFKGWCCVNILYCNGKKKKNLQPSTIYFFVFFVLWKTLTMHLLAMAIVRMETNTKCSAFFHIWWALEKVVVDDTVKRRFESDGYFVEANWGINHLEAMVYFVINHRVRISGFTLVCNTGRLSRFFWKI